MAVVGRFKGLVVQVSIRADAYEVVVSDGVREIAFPLLAEAEQPQCGAELIVEVRNA